MDKASSDQQETSATPNPAGVIRSALDVVALTRGRVVIIGLRGIGLHLTRAVVTFAAGLRLVLSPDEQITILLCDGDEYGVENGYRMDVPDLGNKAAVLGQQLLDHISVAGLNIRWHEEYVTQQNVAEIIRDGACVLLACDNHATRKLVGNHCAGESLGDVVLISGGNDGVEEGNRGTYGNVQVYVRARSNHVTAPLEEFHPEIKNPPDRPPADMDCLELAAAGVPQLSFVNLAVASAMCNALLRLLMPPAGEPMYDEVSLDIVEAVSTPHWLYHG